jgi:hypothetical protein
MSEPYGVRLATDEDLERDFGPERILFGLPVRPPTEDTPPTSEQVPPESDKQ